MEITSAFILRLGKLLAESITPEMKTMMTAQKNFWKNKFYQKI
jgi:hypothetical protein